MTESGSGLGWLVPAAFLVLAWLVPVIALWLLARRFTARADESGERLQQLADRLEEVTNTVNALCAGAVGVDKRMARLEQLERDMRQRQQALLQQLRELEQRQQTAEQQAAEQPNTGDARSYGQAIRMVRQGAGVEHLMAECNMSRSEAELVVMLHGMRRGN